MAASIFFMTDGSSVQRNSNRAGVVAELEQSSREQSTS